MSKKVLQKCVGFDWDEGNSDKNWIDHRVSIKESEQVFFNSPLIIADDKKHSKFEKRYHALGRSDQNRLLFIAFTIRQDLIRIISARDMNNRERRKYHEKVKRDSRL